MLHSAADEIWTGEYFAIHYDLMFFILTHALVPSIDRILRLCWAVPKLSTDFVWSKIRSVQVNYSAYHLKSLQLFPISVVKNRITEISVKTIQDRNLQEKLPQIGRLLVQHFANQVIGHEITGVTPKSIENCLWICPLLYRKSSQA